LLLDLARKSDTTELHQGLRRCWVALMVHLASFGGNARDQADELASWYRYGGTASGIVAGPAVPVSDSSEPAVAAPNRLRGRFAGGQTLQARPVAELPRASAHTDG
jgi:hypothetical protein